MFPAPYEYWYNCSRESGLCIVELVPWSQVASPIVLTPFKSKLEGPVCAVELLNGLFPAPYEYWYCSSNESGLWNVESVPKSKLSGCSPFKSKLEGDTGIKVGFIYW